MLDGASVVVALGEAGVTHVVWLPDSDLGTWDRALSEAKNLTLVRVCREGEAFAVAAGLWLGGKKPIVILQCTGLFEAGDALRNVIHDLHVPLFLIVGVRSKKLHDQGQSRDSCPVFTEPILQAWRVPYRWLAENEDATAIKNEYSREPTVARALLIAE